MKNENDIRDLLEAHCEYHASAELRERVMKAAAHAQVERSSRRWWPWMAAAVILIVGGAGLYIYNKVDIRNKPDKVEYRVEVRNDKTIMKTPAEEEVERYRDEGSVRMNDEVVADVVADVPKPADEETYREADADEPLEAADDEPIAEPIHEPDDEYAYEPLTEEDLPAEWRSMASIEEEPEEEPVIDIIHERSNRLSEMFDRKMQQTEPQP